MRERLLPRAVLDLPRQLADFAAATERRFEALEGRLGEVEGRLGEVEGQVKPLRTDVDARGRQLDQLRTDVAPIKAAHVINAARRLAYWIAEVQGLEFVDILEPQDLRLRHGNVPLRSSCSACSG